MLRLLASIVMLGTVSGCTSVNSSDVKTSGMSAEMQVVADGSGSTHVGMQLHVDTNVTDFVKLTQGDSLTASQGSQTATMSQTQIFGGTWYDAEFTGADAEGTQFTVSFNRASDVSAPNSTATLPKPFNITAPSAGKSFSRANDDIVVSYDSAGTSDSMSWLVDSDDGCVSLQSGTVPNDSGTFTIAKGSLVPTDMSAKTMTCQVTLTLKRTRSGMIDSRFGYGGNASGIQQRTLQFASAP